MSSPSFFNVLSLSVARGKNSLDDLTVIGIEALTVQCDWVIRCQVDFP